MKHVYLINEKSRASIYGIGTYMTQLIDSLKYKKDIQLHYVQLNAEVEEVKIEYSDGLFYHSFPSLIAYKSTPEHQEKYYRNISFLLFHQISGTEYDSLVFQMNYEYQFPIIRWLKFFFPDCLVLFTIHYQTWVFTLNGNTNLFKEITCQNEEELSLEKSKAVYRSFQREKQLYEAVDMVVSLCHYTEVLLTDYYKLDKNKVVMIKNGLKDDYPSTRLNKQLLRKKYHFSNDEQLFLFVGRLDEMKGVDLLIEGFKLFLEKYTKARLILVGSGNYASYLQQTIGCWGHIIITGHLAKSELYEFYQLADYGVLLSLHEQCSYTAIEMQMFGLPILLAANTGLTDFVVNEENGLLVDIEERGDTIYISPELICQRLAELLSLDYNKMQASSRSQFLKNFDQHIMGENYCKIISSYMTEQRV